MTVTSTSQVVTEVARDLVAQVAPQEVPLFRAVSTAYFEDPAALEQERGSKGDMLGFGSGAITEFITPAVLSITSAVVSLVVTFVAEALKQEASDVLVARVRTMFRPITLAEAHDLTARRTSTVYTERARLHQVLVDYFDLGELKTLCFDLGIDDEILSGDNKSDRSRELVVYCERRGRIAELVEAGRLVRPNAPWPTTIGLTAITPPPTPPSPAGSLALTDLQLAHVRDMALLKARQLQLPDDRATLLADALVGSLAMV